MGITAVSGPNVSYGTVMTSSAGTGLLGNDMEHNDQRGPNVSDLGFALMDPRVAYAYNPGSGVTDQFLGFYNNTGLTDYVPVTKSTNAFVSQTVASTGVTTFSINTASSAAGTYATTIIAPETGKVSGALFAIDSTAATLQFGSAGTVGVWNPGAGSGRCVQIITSSSGDGGTFSIAGRDMYGFKMTETLAVSQGTSDGTAGYLITSQKAFKYISAISNTSTPTSTSVTIGLADVVGFPLYTGYLGFNAQARLLASAYSSVVQVALSSATSQGSSGSGVVLGQSSIATQTSTTPDVRGTYHSSTAFNGTLRIQLLVTPSASAIAAITSTNIAPLFGANQFSSV